jgi:hypothetical protein
VLPGGQSHADQPNWRPAETIEEYFANCREGLERYSDARAAKLLGCSRQQFQRGKLMAELPDDLFERLVTLRPVPSTKSLAQAAIALRRLENSIAEVERCPHCGHALRIRLLVNAQVQRVINDWLKEQTAGPPCTPP